MRLELLYEVIDNYNPCQGRLTREDNMCKELTPEEFDIACDMAYIADKQHQLDTLNLNQAQISNKKMGIAMMQDRIDIKIARYTGESV